MVDRFAGTKIVHIGWVCVYKYHDEYVERLVSGRGRACISSTACVDGRVEWTVLQSALTPTSHPSAHVHTVCQPVCSDNQHPRVVG